MSIDVKINVPIRIFKIEVSVFAQLLSQIPMHVFNILERSAICPVSIFFYYKVDM